MNNFSKGWNLIPLEKIANLKAGGTPKRIEKKYWDGDIPWVVIKDIPKSGKVSKTSEKISLEGLKNSSTVLFPKNTILFTIFATIGKVGRLEIEACTNQSIVGINTKDPNVDNDFLYESLRFYSDELKKMGRGVAQNNINQTILKQFKIPIPPLIIQKKIVSILQKSNRIKETHDEINQLKKLLIKSIFVKMFGDPMENDLGWKNVKLGQILEKVQYGTSSALNESDGITCLRMNNISREGEMNFSKIKYYDGNDYEKYLLKEEELLFNRTNSRDLVGKTGIFNSKSNVIFAGYLIRLVVDKKKADPFFVHTLMNNETAKKQIRMMAKGSVGQANINAKEIQSLEIILPPLELQQKFRNVLLNILSLLNSRKDLEQYYQNVITTIYKRTLSGEFSS